MEKGKTEDEMVGSHGAWSYCMKTKIVENLFDQQGGAEVIAERLMITAQSRDSSF